ncbi:MAG: cation diffusion facilitator family transporter [Acetivibrio sp.]
MILLLEKIFIKNRKDTASPKVRQAYGVLCGSVGIGFNLILFLGKFLAGTWSNSIAITADAFNNLSDAGSSVITLLGFKIAGQKPDKAHPFGHGRVEYLSGLLVSGAILIMAFELIKTSIGKIIHPAPVNFNFLSLGILVVSILVKMYMTYYNRKIGEKIHSAAMKATATDSLSDTLATGMVLIAAIVGKATGYDIDGYCGVLVGLFILYAGYDAAKETLAPLLGQPPEKEFVDEIKSIVMEKEEILGIHDLIVHDYGPGRIMISLHAEVSASGDIIAMHDTIDNVERELQEKLFVDVVIHMDPVIQDDEEINALKEMTRQILRSMDESISMHDFRVVKGPTHTNLIFDVVIPFDYKLGDAEVGKCIEEEIKKADETCFAVIKVDKNYLKDA